MNIIDLHVHSTKSDGSMTPTELVHYAIEKGLSAFALHPIYIDIAKLPEFEDISKDKDFEKKYKDFIKKFPYDGKTRYDYDGILNAKDELLRVIYETTTIAKSAMPSEELTKWIKKNPWIVNYAVYKNLKHKYMQATWKSWKKQDQEVSEKEIKNRWNKDAEKNISSTHGHKCVLLNNSKKLVMQ